MFLAHDNAGTSENYLAALKTAEGLWDGEPDNERYFAVYAEILCHHGDVNEMEGRPGQAAAYYKRSLRASETFFEELLAEDD